LFYTTLCRSINYVKLGFSARGITHIECHSKLRTEEDIWT